MTEITLETVTGKLNPLCYEAFMQSLRHAKKAGHRNVELAHWVMHLLQQPGSDLSLTIDHYGLSRAKLNEDIANVVNGFRAGATEMPSVSASIIDLLDRGWHYATLFFFEAQVRSGHLLVSALKTVDLSRPLNSLSAEFGKIPIDDLARESRNIWRRSDEESMRPIDGAGLGVGQTADGSPAATTALARFSQDLTARAKEGAIDPVLGREAEIRQIIDVLMRRRQNNPILTGEAGVGKTAVVEGLAQRIAAGDVPPPLKGVRLCALDVGLLLAGASMKGEFEQRLRAVIDEVQSSPVPVILFIDEAHTLIGAGGQAGTGDAANLLKPPLARGTLRTIAATTWSEYRQYIEKDPALTRRFQPIQVDEPDVERCCDMLRGMLPVLEQHHGVRISDAAVRSAVRLSQRYIPARQLPDKAVSLLDTACARVALSQNSIPAKLEDLTSAIASAGRELKRLEEEATFGADAEERISSLRRTMEDLTSRKMEIEEKWAQEKQSEDRIRELQERIRSAEGGDVKALRADLVSEMDGRDPESRLIYSFVDEHPVAEVVSEWTGVPIGRMVKNEIETVLSLADVLGRRVVGQQFGLETIARRIETSRARLDNPDKPVGVFLLCGPSGVGKTETALTLAEVMYGGGQNLITINMSEFQEAHSVATLRGAPPGYVGYGEGGRLTEAVRRRPYSVVLLDEVEKAHPDVHEIFFQVFDKGQMEDGSGRRIDFRNTLFILTSNVGTDLISSAVRDPLYRDDPQALATDLKPELLKVFPPALLGRVVVVPYYPLSDDMLRSIAELQFERIRRRLREAHGVELEVDERAMDHVVAMCNDPASGGRMIDNILTNTVLPTLSRRLLKSSLDRELIQIASISVADDAFTFSFS